ncbi:type VII secretion-associated serine protease mycosin [Pseudosporangium ferrugineum]|uniref:Type VII secretion-associated serine protease mycosin n=1 Tax=Pseudosporangium ferrugineum TaxID=439699 RepID=A0A2T0S4I9_9ACTN|nr:type VII secretion-associated serine protease mycosin [Pseudosporangium ferrugineum]PRY28339.1 type VII secretion-associated serine protease mycosin [Pseudosporangium ferrugineum]
MRQRLAASLAVALILGFAGIGDSPALADDVRKGQWHLKYLRVSEAHRLSTGKGVTVAVIDSGVSEHPDLAGSILHGKDFVDPGGSGRTDADGHGTSMAGLIAAHGADGAGTLGIAPDAKILPIRVLKDGPRNAEIGPAIDYAVAHGAKVINISISGGLDAVTINAVRAATEANVVVVAAAGNRPEDAGVTSPAILDDVVAVAAVDRSGTIAKISVTGPAIDLAAPGEDITTTANKNEYAVEQKGTSDAAAMVSGAAALIRSKFPEMSAEEVVARLESTATDKGPPGVDDEYGHGIVNIVAALSYNTTPASAAPSSSPPAPTADASPKGEDKTEPAGNNTPLIAGGAIVVLLAGLVGILWVRRRSAR